MKQEAFDPRKWHKTRHPGIEYRERAGGKRTYYVSRRRAGTTEREALAVQAELRGRRARGESVVLPAKVTFAELAERWLETKASRLRTSTRTSYRASLDLVLLPRFGSWKVAAIDADAISKLIRDLEREGLHAIDPKRPRRPLTGSAIQSHLKPLSGTLRFAVRRRMIAANPMTHLTSDDRPQPKAYEQPHEWTEEQIEALLRASRELAAEPEARQDYSLLLTVAIATGMRLGELLGLEWRDIDFDQRRIAVRRQWTKHREFSEPKTVRGTREVPIGDELAQQLRRHRLASRYSQPTQPVFANARGGRLLHRNVQRRAFERARDRAGLPETLHFHDLRHAFASRAAHRGVPIQIVSDVLGHRDVGITTQVYLHLWDRRQAEEAFRAAMDGAQ